MGAVCAADDVSEADPLATLARALPTDVADYRPATADRVRAVALDVERWAVETGSFDEGETPNRILGAVQRLVDAKQQVDALLKKTLQKRIEFVDLDPGPDRRVAVRSYLASMATLTDLAGQLRYISHDLFSDAAYDLASDRVARERLVDVLIQGKNSMGAIVLATALFDPPAATRVPPASGRVRGKILELIRATGQNELVPQVARFVRQPGLSPRLVLLAALTLRHVGLPQDPLPDQDPTLPKPAITASDLFAIVSAIEPSRLDGPWSKIHSELLGWLDQRRRKGVVGDTYRVGRLTVRDGDWLLMRNPSPYNLFTDLSPGLFTHVGVVTVQTGEDGIRRFVVIDLPETGSFIAAVTVDTFVKRTLDYLFLRHTDPKVATRMGRVAHQVIGNESHFDLNFRTQGIESLRGKSLAGKKIQGYCAGVLLLCCQETDRPRSEFFPIPEHPATGKTLANLAKLGVSIQEDFLSPTGPLFSPAMRVVGRREPMYSPRRQIEQAVYDHFARQMHDRDLVPAPDWLQAVRLKLAEASAGNPALKQALAQAAGVNRNMDLVAAAKLGAVVETLDKFAYGASNEFRDARTALLRGPVRRRARLDREAMTSIAKYRRRHARLFSLWEAEQISPRDLRIALVDYYIASGCRNLDERFFRKDAS